ncbi:uncharacterized protein LOC129908827 isoform X2 [Episyrphus balteatus]|uniref:uncharacterized protein LOC129908827 isoform X2 n=1 Tax=Episyrphus balteatus TaxID=286459 RepID=UPI0024855775|nr:uncharacterized protein LOC129908827 isoform X2 [Episyrphus balteatus]
MNFNLHSSQDEIYEHVECVEFSFISNNFAMESTLIFGPQKKISYRRHQGLRKEVSILLKPQWIVVQLHRPHIILI